MQGHSQLHSQLEASPGYLPLYNQIPKTFTSLIMSEQFVGCCLHPRVGDTYRIARRCCRDLRGGSGRGRGILCPKAGQAHKGTIQAALGQEAAGNPRGWEEWVGVGKGLGSVTNIDSADTVNPT